MEEQEHGTLLVVDCERRAFGSLEESLVNDVSERHGFCLPTGLSLECAGNLVNQIEKSERAGILYVLRCGLPGRKVLRGSASALKKGMKVYYFWINESAIEFIDRDRYYLYKNLYFIQVLIRILRICYKAIAPILAPVVKFLRIVRQKIGNTRRLHVPITRDFVVSRTNRRNPDANFLPVELPTRQAPIGGTGLYVRLDYWVRLITGGSFGHTCFVAKALSQVTQDFECLFAAPYDLLNELRVRQSIIGSHFSSSRSIDLILNARKMEGDVQRHFDQVRPSYVYERIVLGNSLAANICSERNIPYIVEYNGSELAMARTFNKPHELEALLEMIEATAFNYASVINVISDPVAQSLRERGVGAEKILVNPNGVDPNIYCPAEGPARKAIRKELGVSDSDVIVGFCGTFGGWHGIDVLAAGLPRICGIADNVKFLLIGDGNLKSQVLQTIADHGLESKVVDVGRVAQAVGARYLGVADILVATHAQLIDGKAFFGSPTKLFEYMAVGAGIVCSDLAQLGEVMRPSLTAGDFLNGPPSAGNARGLLFTPGNVDEYVWSVEQLIMHPDLRRHLGYNARSAVIENYTWDIHVENIWRHLKGQPLRGYIHDRLR